MGTSTLLIPKKFNLQLYQNIENMKKAVLMILYLLLSMTFIGCSKEEPQIDPSKCTTVTIYCCEYHPYNGKYTSMSDIKFQSILISDANGRIVGSGEYAGDYLVPYNGEITLIHYLNFNKQTVDSYRVGMSAHMYIMVYYDPEEGLKTRSEVTSGKKCD